MGKSKNKQWILVSMALWFMDAWVWNEENRRATKKKWKIISNFRRNRMDDTFIAYSFCRLVWVLLHGKLFVRACVTVRICDFWVANVNLVFVPAHGLIKLIKLKFSEFNDAIRIRIAGRVLEDGEGQNVTISFTAKNKWKYWSCTKWTRMKWNAQ